MKPLDDGRFAEFGEVIVAELQCSGNSAHDIHARPLLLPEDPREMRYVDVGGSAECAKRG